jgi:hypothetical protein
MILESAQMLSTAHRVLDGDAVADAFGMYKKTHMNHPSSLWVRDNDNHYVWLHTHMVALCQLYTLESGKVHKTETKLLRALSEPPKNIKRSDRFSLPTPAMPEMYIGVDTTRSYQLYLNDKFKEWQQRDKPLAVEWTLDKPKWVTTV